MQATISSLMTQMIKMMLQHVILPLIYTFWCLVYTGKEVNLVVFADSNHDEIPASMVLLHDELIKRGELVVDAFHNCGKGSQVSSLLYALHFMKLYAQAKCVFICDNFHPVISCHKKKETKVVQLWHACGAYKKFGYATSDDIPKYYVGHMYKNYDLVTVSAPFCVKPFEESMHQKHGVVQPLGISRTDVYFDKEWIQRCRNEFYRQYPQAEGKKIVLWAPTFRGSAGSAYQIGMEEMKHLEQALGDDYFMIYKLHPHIDAKHQLSNCTIVTEKLFPVVDLLITDYSSVLFDFMAFKKPYVLFVPDLHEYGKIRGFYLEIGSLTPYFARDEFELLNQVQTAFACEEISWIEEKYDTYLKCCDGNATERILRAAGF